ncbi:translation initiation factor [Aquimarina sp. ERC-38]|uniref:translation initiation factor n=1 Tax=Aquimarina sp. ERC-38 TaxID=2949996 RepID=UPI0022466570|nr:translation initiation factor [Aquimarina sp. ERC-38]UZO80252.1 translation initiation factor [Aquimarina sp. ERC-38]
MDLKDQLKNLFPEHKEEEVTEHIPEKEQVWIQDAALLCKYEKKKGKPITIIDGYNGATDDFKKLAKQLKKSLNTGGSFKDEKIIIQGDYRDQIMQMLKNKGFSVKRVGG